MAGLSRHQSVSAAAWRGQGSSRKGDRGDTGLYAGQADEAHARGGEAGSGRSKSRSSIKAAILTRDLNGLQADPVQAGSIDPTALQTYLQRSITGTLSGVQCSAGCDGCLYSDFSSTQACMLRCVDQSRAWCSGAGISSHPDHAALAEGQAACATFRVPVRYHLHSSGGLRIAALPAARQVGRPRLLAHFLAAPDQSCPSELLVRHPPRGMTKLRGRIPGLSLHPPNLVHAGLSCKTSMHKAVLSGTRHLPSATSVSHDLLSPGVWRWCSAASAARAPAQPCPSRPRWTCWTRSRLQQLMPSWAPSWPASACSPTTLCWPRTPSPCCTGQAAASAPPSTRP